MQISKETIAKMKAARQDDFVRRAAIALAKEFRESIGSRAVDVRERFVDAIFRRCLELKLSREGEVMTILRWVVHRKIVIHRDGRIEPSAIETILAKTFLPAPLRLIRSERWLARNQSNA